MTLLIVPQAVEDELLSGNPALRLGKYLRRGDEPQPKIQPLARDEARHLVVVAEAQFPRWHPWVLLALRTGLRLGEQLALQWGDIDFNGRRAQIQRNLVRGVLTSPKSHQRRFVDLSAELADTLLGWRRLQRARWLQKGQALPPWVFPSLEGSALDERNVRHVFARMLQTAELRQIRIHDCRHTFASLLLQAGAPITYVSQQLGHADPSITFRVYAHYLPDGSQKDVDRLDDGATGRNPGATRERSSAERGRRNVLKRSGEPPRNRTGNPQIKSLLLCQLS